MELTNRLVQQMSVRQLQSLRILQMNQLELYGYLQKLAMENPLIDLDVIHRKSEQDSAPEVEQMFAQYQWLINSDGQNLQYHCQPEEESDPFLFVGNGGGLEETLQRHLYRQAETCQIGADTRAVLFFLIECLDDDGYLRVPKADILEKTGCSEERYSLALECLQKMDPPGVGAGTLSECLMLQLRSAGADEQTCDIVAGHLEEIAAYQFDRVAKLYGISEREVKSLLALIRTFSPKPGLAFSKSESTPYVEPDVAVVVREGKAEVHPLYKKEQYFHINSSYLDLLQTCEDAETRQYLAEKLQQAKAVDFGLSQRESALERYLSYIVRRQSSFFSGGSLSPLTMTDAAHALGVHVSTVSRATRNKYLICDRGVFPLPFFFSHAVSAGSSISADAAKTMIKSIIAQENRSHPLSDRQLSDLLTRKGCEISRRTVAKYRMELHISKASVRKQQYRSPHR